MCIRDRYIAQHPRLIRAVNYPPETPGGGFVVVEVSGGRRALVLQAMGRLYMDPLDCPFRTTADLLARYKLGASVQAIVADIHAEASSEKMAVSYTHLDVYKRQPQKNTSPRISSEVTPTGTVFSSGDDRNTRA